jgi:beta-phosphoglucomutase-like phosphatase (HAD superfamily)
MDISNPFIFDCDGVLVNTEEIVLRIELAHLAELGLDYDRDDFVSRFTGTADEEFFARLNQDAQNRLGQNLPSGFRDELTAAARSALLEELQAVQGAGEFIEMWAGPKAVASSSGLQQLYQKLESTSLKSLFGNNIFSAESVARGKPAPDVFVYAAEQLAVPTSRCLVLEDSINGVLAGKAAGMQVIGFTGGGHCGPQHADGLRAAGAQDVVDSFEQLGNLFDLNC